jgi:hypothetical protein
LVNGLGGFEGVGILGCCLEPNFYDIEWLTWIALAGRLIDSFKQHSKGEFIYTRMILPHF